MKYSSIIKVAAAFVITAAFFTQPVEAKAKTSGSSAALLTQVEAKAIDRREEILTAFLKQYDSPMVGSAHTFIEEADKNHLDWKFVVSIAGVESWFGQRIPYNSKNAWGWGVYGNHVTYFSSWDEGITTISGELRSKYMDRWGARNVYEIGNFYAADPHWAYKVTNFMNKLEMFEAGYVSTELPISI